MKTKLIALALFGLSFASCRNPDSADASQEVSRNRSDSVEQDNIEVENKRSTVYTCKVHPEVARQAPGTCPKCKRTLVQVTD